MVGSVKNLFLVDTPGQIEAFMWSASGEIITKTLAATMPTAMCFILDRYLQIYLIFYFGTNIIKL